MKLKSLLTIALAIITTVAAAQKEIVVGSKEYDMEKMNGNLDQYSIFYNINIFDPIEKTGFKSNKPVSNGVEKSDGCDCYVEPDMTYTLALQPSDDGSSPAINLPFSFNFYGTTYNSLYINNNGNVTFGNSLSTYSSTAFPSANNRIIAPFWADVDTRGGNGQVLYKITPTAIYINWVSVGYYNTQGDKRNTFQLILTNGSDPAVPDGNNVAFCYQDMQWTTGAASCSQSNSCSYNGNTYACGGSGGFCGIPATAGANKGDNITYFLLGRFDHAGDDFDGALGDPDGISWLDDKQIYFNTTSTGGNVPPVIVEQLNCDTIFVDEWGELIEIPIVVFAPELDQLTTITFNNDGLNSIQLNNSVIDNTSFANFEIIATDADNGIYNITLFAEDNYALSPGLSAYTFTVVIDIDCSTSGQPHASFSQSNSTIDVDETVVFNQYLCNVPTSWSWTITPGMEGQDWEFVNGTDENSENPEVQFLTFGIYSVALEVSNAFGSDSITSPVTVLGTLGTCNSGSMIGCFDPAFNPYISKVKIGAYENSSMCSEYSNFSNQLINVHADSNYVIEIISEITGVAPDTLNYLMKVGVWIDWNKNGNFEDQDEFIGLANLHPGGLSDLSLYIPSSLLTGNIKMRIRVADADTTQLSPCDVTLRGEVEDYRLHVINTLGLSSFSWMQNISLFPNPANEYIEIVIPDNENELELELLDLNGKTVLKRLRITPEMNKVSISNLESGVYFARLISGDEVVTRKIIKQ